MLAKGNAKAQQWGRETRDEWGGVQDGDQGVGKQQQGSEDIKGKGDNRGDRKRWERLRVGRYMSQVPRG